MCDYAALNAALHKDEEKKKKKKSKNDIKKTWETIADVMSKSKIQNKFPAHFNINEK